MNRPRLHQGGRPGASRTVRLVPLRRTGLDHRELARILLAIISSGDTPGGEGEAGSSSTQSSNFGSFSPAEGTTTALAANTGSSAGQPTSKERLP